MPLPYWFGVTLTFTCPACHKISIEKMALNAGTQDRALIMQSINRQKLSCQLCKKPLTDGVDVSVNVQPASLEELKKLGLDIQVRPDN